MLDIEVNDSKGVLIVALDDPDLFPATGSSAEISSSHDGAFVFTATGVVQSNVVQSYGFVAFPNVDVVDPTGAGDSFAGGVLGYISKYGLDNPVKAVMHGTAVASFTVSAFGLENLYDMSLDIVNEKIKDIKIL